MPARRPARAPRAAPPTTEIADRLHSAAIHLLRRARREDDATGLPAPRLSALSVVVYAGPITLGALARAEQVRPPTMTRIVSALEAGGLVRRSRDPGDRRVVRLSATAAGARVLERGRERRIAALARELDALPARELAAIGAALGVLERVVGARARWRTSAEDRGGAG